MCFEYGGARVLSDVNLDLPGPGLVCIIGPNGVGKSTLIRCMDGLAKPAKGRILVNGRPLDGMSIKEISKEISYVPVSDEELFSMPVIESLLVAMDAEGMNDGERLAKASAALRLLGIEDLAMRQTNELSAGQKQKVAIARGIARDTEIMLLDEPTANLDVKHQIRVTELLKAVADRCGMLIIMISHDLNIASRFADTIVVLSEPGVVHSVGSPAEVIDEGTVESVYGVECRIVINRGRPHVMLGSVIEPDA